jgi:serine phosphatase RsbU (regulator of sigma subunit)
MANDVLEWGVASLLQPGQEVTGDRFLILPGDNRFLLAAIDGVGHGSEAALAAELAVAELRKHDDTSLVSLIAHCHRALQPTRGVVMTLVLVLTETSELCWLGIGNVEGRLIRSRQAGRLIMETLLPRGGVVGHDMPSNLAVSTTTIHPGNLIVLATDGIHHDFTEDLYPGKSVQSIADDIMNHHHKGTDDALALVARYQGVAV